MYIIVVYLADDPAEKSWIWQPPSETADRILSLSDQERMALEFDGEVKTCSCKLHSDLTHAYLNVSYNGIPILRYPFFSVKQVEEMLSVLRKRGYLWTTQSISIMLDVCSLVDNGLEEKSSPETELAAAEHMYYDCIRKIFARPPVGMN